MRQLIYDFCLWHLLQPSPLPPVSAAACLALRSCVLVAGYCVDGTPDMGSVEINLFGWKYENCDLAYPGRLGSHFDTAVSVEVLDSH